MTDTPETTSPLEPASLPDPIVALNAKIDELDRKARVLHNAILCLAWDTEKLQAKRLLEREFDLEAAQ